MNSNSPSKRTAILVFALFIALGLTVSIALPNFVRDSIVTPIYYLFWLIGLLIRSLDQKIIWAFLVLVAIVVIVRVWMTRPKSYRKKAPQEEAWAGKSRIAQWSIYIRLMFSNIYGETYFFDEVRQLLFEIMAYQYHVSKSDVEEMIQSGQIEVPEPIYGYLFSWRRDNPVSIGWIDRMKEGLARFFHIPDPRLAGRNQKLQAIIRYLDVLTAGEGSPEPDPQSFQEEA
jgi:hypothetical protein